MKTNITLCGVKHNSLTHTHSVGHLSHITLTLRQNANLKQMTVNSRYIGKPDVLTKFTLERPSVCVCVMCRWGAGGCAQV